MRVLQGLAMKMAMEQMGQKPPSAQNAQNRHREPVGSTAVATPNPCAERRCRTPTDIGPAAYPHQPLDAAVVGGTQAPEKQNAPRSDMRSTHPAQTGDGESRSDAEGPERSPHQQSHAAMLGRPTEATPVKGGPGVQGAPEGGPGPNPEIERSDGNGVGEGTPSQVSAGVQVMPRGEPVLASTLRVNAGRRVGGPTREAHRPPLPVSAEIGAGMPSYMQTGLLPGDIAAQQLVDEAPGKRMVPGIREGDQRVYCSSPRKDAVGRERKTPESRKTKGSSFSLDLSPYLSRKRGHSTSGGRTESALGTLGTPGWVGVRGMNSREDRETRSHGCSTASSGYQCRERETSSSRGECPEGKVQNIHGPPQHALLMRRATQVSCAGSPAWRRSKPGTVGGPRTARRRSGGGVAGRGHGWRGWRSRGGKRGVEAGELCGSGNASNAHRWWGQCTGNRLQFGDFAGGPWRATRICCPCPPPHALPSFSLRTL